MENERTFTVFRTCQHCNRQVDFKVVEQDYREWQKGKLIQKAMPYISTDEREILISGICGGCFDRMFKEE